ncbi:hypothetical protein E2562_009824 [Oryza meyeriana var. granulata]|uniref:MATH domain-containing protein n=1 Tax=Oryza meyeriana var. granulata TaxID=110450 RepID=A0A6G1BST5_9ORYZ|nr:hypothetical protein E2562_009824 [Oryza meyeriana var. granulata]
MGNMLTRAPTTGPRPASTTGRRSCISSAIVAEAASGSHTLKIDGYSRAKATVGNGRFVESVPFSVAGHDWVIRYYPNGLRDDAADWVTAVLSLPSAAAADGKDVLAEFSFSVLDKDGKPAPGYTCTSNGVRTFSRKGCLSWATNKFIKIVDFEGSPLIRDDCVIIRCDVTVIKGFRSEETELKKKFVVVAPSNLYQHLGDLLKNMDGADVTFEVGDERFYAHTDRYDVERLKLMCEERLCDHIDSNIVASSLALAEQHNCHGLKEACFEFLSSPSNLEETIASDGFEHLKNSCPSVLKELITRFLPPELTLLKNITMALP